MGKQECRSCYTWCFPDEMLEGTNLCQDCIDAAEPTAEQWAAVVVFDDADGGDA